MTPRSAVPPMLAAGVCLLLLLGFVVGQDLHVGVFRVYGGTTDVMPHKETLFFVAVALLGTAATWYAALALERLAGERLLAGARRAALRPAVTVAALAGFAFLATALVSWLSLQHAPILLDEQLYEFQVNLLRAGGLTAPLPEPLGPWREFYAVQKEGIWTGIYPWGHVAALLPGYVVGFPVLVPHLCAAAAVVLTYLLGRELFPEDGATPLLGAAAVAVSPFVAFTCGTTHNVTTSMVLTNLGLLGLARAVSRASVGNALLAGLAFGLALHSRPLNAIGIAVPAGIVALATALRLGGRRPVLLALAFAAGLIPGIAGYFAINLAVTGDLMQTPAGLSMPKKLRIFGFGGDGMPGVPHTPLLAFGKLGTNLVRMTMWTTGSIAALAGMLALAGGLRRRTFDLVLLLPVASIFGLYYFFFTSPAYDTGPLYYLDLVPACALALGRSAVALADRTGGPRAPRLGLALGLSAALVALATFWPMQGLAGRRVTDNTLLPYRTVERAGVTRDAIVWFNWNPYFKSWTLPPRPPKPDLSDDVLFAKYAKGWADELWERYRDERTFYQLVFDGEGGASLEVWYPEDPWPNMSR